jgi:2-oxoisovalerate dehydrogenase E1 component
MNAGDCLHAAPYQWQAREPTLTLLGTPSDTKYEGSQDKYRRSWNALLSTGRTFGPQGSGTLSHASLHGPPGPKEAESRRFCTSLEQLVSSRERSRRRVGKALSPEHFDFVIQHDFTVEDEPTPESLTLEEQRQPERIVGPHSVVGDGAHWTKHRRGLIGFLRFPQVVFGRKDRAVEAVAIHELEEQLADLDQSARPDQELLFELTESTLKRRFARLESPTRAVDLARAEPTLLVNQEDTASPNDEHQRRPILRHPPGPIELRGPQRITSTFTHRGRPSSAASAIVHVDSQGKPCHRWARCQTSGYAPCTSTSAGASRSPPGTTQGRGPSIPGSVGSFWSRCCSLAQKHLGLYTITSAGHEANVVLGRLTRVTDPSLVHYRSTALYLERARQVPGLDPVRELMASLVGARSDPASGGRHKVFGHPALGIIPQTSTIASHLPRAVGLAFALGLDRPAASKPWRSGLLPPTPDSVILASFGDASINHSTWLGAVNAAGWAVEHRRPMPLLLVCEDNGLGISVRSPPGWVAARLGALRHVTYFHAPRADVEKAYRAASRALEHCRKKRAPAILHLECVRLLGHWGHDRDEVYRSHHERASLGQQDPLFCLGRALLAGGVLSQAELLAWQEAAHERVAAAAAWASSEPRQTTYAEIAAPLAFPEDPEHPVEDCLPSAVTESLSQPGLGANRDPIGPRAEPAHLTLAQGIRAALAEGMQRYPEMLVYGEDVAKKGGLYGITRGLCERFGPARVFDTLLDEQTILGLGLGASQVGYLPVPEIQYLAFLHNALDQLRGEAASLPFFSGGKLTNPLVVRVPSFADPSGPGGHFHNDHSIAMLRDIPGLVLAVPARADDALALYRTAFQLAKLEGRVMVVLEPTCLYAVRDLGHAGDGQWLAPPALAKAPFGRARVYGDGPAELAIASYGRGVWLSRRVAQLIQQSADVGVRVLDLRWLAPLPMQDILSHGEETGRLLVVDDCRRSGGIAEAVGTAMLEQTPKTRFARVTSADCFVPIGPAAAKVLVSEDQVLTAAKELLGRRASR